MSFVVLPALWTGLSVVLFFVFNMKKDPCKDLTKAMPLKKHSDPLLLSLHRTQESLEHPQEAMQFRSTGTLARGS